jgi:hypothetical protein
MVQPRPAGTTGKRSHPQIRRSPQTTRGGSARGARILRPMLRQRGSRCLDPAAFRPAGETIMRAIGISCRSRAIRRGGHRGKGMQARASGLAAPWGPADQDQPCGAQRFVAEDLRITGSRRAFLDATHGRAAIVAAPARIGVSSVGTRQVFAGGPARGCALSRVLNGLLSLRGEDSSARAQRMIVLGRSQMPSLPPLLSDSPLCARGGAISQAWHMIGLHRGCTAAVRRARGVWPRPTITAVPRRRPAHSPPHSDDDIR